MQKKLKYEWTVPNIISMVRLLAVPLLAWLIWNLPKYQQTAFITYMAIWVTDMLDGWIARTYNQVSEFGKLFDPLVDKIFMTTTAVMMCVIGRTPLWMPVVMIIRESLMILGGLFLLKRRDTVVYSDIFGKLSTALFVIAFALLFWLPEDSGYLQDVVFLPPVALSIIATINYAYKSRDILRISSIREVHAKHYAAKRQHKEGKKSQG